MNNKFLAAVSQYSKVIQSFVSCSKNHKPCDMDQHKNNELMMQLLDVNE